MHNHLNFLARSDDMLCERLKLDHQAGPYLLFVFSSSISFCRAFAHEAMHNEHLVCSRGIVDKSMALSKDWLLQRLPTVTCQCWNFLKICLAEPKVFAQLDTCRKEGISLESSILSQRNSSPLIPSNFLTIHRWVFNRSNHLVYLFSKRRCNVMPGSRSPCSMLAS